MGLASFLNYSPPYRWNPKINTGAVQVARVLANRSKYALSPRYRVARLERYYDVLDRDGIVTIPNFLTPYEFAEIIREYQAVRSGSAPHARIRTFATHGVDSWAAIMTPTDPAFKTTNAIVRNHSTITQLTAYIIRRRIDYFPSTISILTQRLADGATDTTDGNSYLHADVHYHTVKAVLYLNDVTEGGAPFVFGYGSHRLTRERIALEYELAQRIANPKPGELMHGQPIVGDDLIKKYNLDPRPVYAPANTLILADHAGLHARGSFAPGRERATLRISFRFAETPRYRLRSLLNRIRDPYEGFDGPLRAL